MKILKARVDWGVPPEPGKHQGREPRLHILVDALPDGEWVYSQHGTGSRRAYFAEQGGEARFLRSGPEWPGGPWGRVSLKLQDGSAVELDPRPFDPSTVNWLAYQGVPGFQGVVEVTLYRREGTGKVCEGTHYVTLDFAREAAAKCEKPVEGKPDEREPETVYLAQERFGWDESSWRWVPSAAPDGVALPGELLEEGTNE